MALLSRKGLLAIAAVIDVALHGNGRPVSAKVLAARHTLPARHLEPVLQALVRAGILKGTRGPRGGYELARERRRITVADIVRAAGGAADEPAPSPSPLLQRAGLSVLAEAADSFLAALDRITVEDLCKRAVPQSDLGSDHIHDIGL